MPEVIPSTPNDRQRDDAYDDPSGPPSQHSRGKAMKLNTRLTFVALLTTLVAAGVFYLATLVDVPRMRGAVFGIGACLFGIAGCTFGLRTTLGSPFQRG